ncbi:hypothetical protein A2572_04115 [Candidatus Collierbacteria bacterium RIFOXYD1_FULL_40_9]|uniref:Uncharacterized protein n=1 Tax=Candidatus Collierbacteria bacterium RIFOXYD1_FULL_40_9 TaxID=1817731 RepID=A0A1F5FPK5_9BACT|nr:MAG: hypothetical protein A2572_04115 [Candidatus Collierbacteria bacterium RIFOXYD1_FULL_40_9]
MPNNKKKFLLVDVLALFFGRSFAGQQVDAVNEIFTFLTGRVNDKLPIPYLALRKPLIKQLPWLNTLSLSYKKSAGNRTFTDQAGDFEKLTAGEKKAKKTWIENLIHCHGKEVELQPLSSEEVRSLHLM